MLGLAYGSFNANFLGLSDGFFLGLVGRRHFDGFFLGLTDGFLLGAEGSFDANLLGFSYVLLLDLEVRRLL
jgi:hypothetical protein